MTDSEADHTCLEGPLEFTVLNGEASSGPCAVGS